MERELWDLARFGASSRVLFLVAAVSVVAGITFDWPRIAPRFSNSVAYALIAHLWIAIGYVLKRSSERGSVTGRKIILLFLSILLSYSFLYTSMNAVSKNKDFSGTDAEWDATEEEKTGVKVKSHKTLRALGDFAYFSMVSMSTVGYGDVAPRSHKAKFAVCTHLLCTFVLAGVLVNRLESK